MKWGIVAAFAALWVIVGCSSAPSSSADSAGKTAAPTGAVDQAKKLTLAVIPKGTTHVFWKSVQAGADEAGKELGVEIIWKGPLKEDDKDQQIRVVEDFVTRGVDGIALAPLDDAALRTPVTNAQAAGIPVLIFDSALKDVPVVSFVATDNKVAGKLGGLRLAELLGGKGKVILLRYQEGSASTAEREAGFLEAMAENPGITVVSKDQYAGATTETAQKSSENLLLAFTAGEKLSVDGIFTPNESSTFGMLRALQDAGMAGSVKFVGFDSSDLLLEALKKNQLNALVVQNPRKMGYEAVRNLVAHLRGNKVEPRVDTGTAVVDAKNLDTSETKAILGL